MPKENSFVRALAKRGPNPSPAPFPQTSFPSASSVSQSQASHLLQETPGPLNIAMVTRIPHAASDFQGSILLSGAGLRSLSYSAGSASSILSDIWWGPCDEDAIEKATKDLGSEDVKVRDAAQRLLEFWMMVCPDPTERAIRRTAAMTDPEVSARVAEILEFKSTEGVRSRLCWQSTCFQMGILKTLIEALDNAIDHGDPVTAAIAWKSIDNLLVGLMKTNDDCPQPWPTVVRAAQLNTGGALTETNYEFFLKNITQLLDACRQTPSTWR